MRGRKPFPSACGLVLARGMKRPKTTGFPMCWSIWLLRGQRRGAAAQISSAIEDVGGIMNAYTGRDVTAYYVKVLKEDVALGIDLIADILQHSVMDAAELAKEQGVIVQEINMAK